MEKEGFFVETKEMVEQYVEDRLLLLKLQTTEKAAKASSFIFIALAVTFLCLILIMIISFILGYVLSKAVGSYVGGFGILAAIYIILIFILLYLNKKFIAKKIADTVVKFSFDNKETFRNEI
jgi:energy-coupling factor transporter transmembrane protein EcfT